jgi:hypothetical protein
LAVPSKDQIDAAIERVHPALTDRQELIEMVEYALASVREESKMLGLENEC